MFDPGCVLYIKNYAFEDGDGERNKYLIVLCRKDEGVIVGSLTTSKIGPKPFGVSEKKTSCFDFNGNIYHGYFFPEKKVVGVTPNGNGFYFADNTIVYPSNNIRHKDTNALLEDYPGKRMVCKGTLSLDIHRSLLECTMKSMHVPKGAKRLIQAHLSYSIP